MLQKDLIDNHAITNRPQGPSHHGENRPKKVAPPSGAAALGGHLHRLLLTVRLLVLLPPYYAMYINNYPTPHN